MGSTLTAAAISAFALGAGASDSPAQANLPPEQLSMPRRYEIVAGALADGLNTLTDKNRMPFLAVEPIDAVLARALALPAEKDEKPPAAEAPPRIGEIAQLGARLGVDRALRRVARAVSSQTSEVRSKARGK